MISSLDYTPRGLLVSLRLVSPRVFRASTRPDLAERVVATFAEWRWEVWGLRHSVEHDFLQEPARVLKSPWRVLSPFELEFNRRLFAFLIREEQNRVRRYFWIPPLPRRPYPQARRLRWGKRR